MKITKRQLRRIIKEEKAKLLKESRAVDYRLVDDLDSLRYNVVEEILGRVAMHNREWRNDPAIKKHLIDMLDQMKRDLFLV